MVSKTGIKTNYPFIITAAIVYLFCVGIALGIEHWEEKTKLVNPIHIFFEDFDITDLYYQVDSSRHPADKVDEILVINAMCADRAKLGRLVKTVNQFTPQVVGLDFYFPDEIVAPAGSGSFDSVIQSSHNLVIGFDLPDAGNGKAPEIKHGDNADGFVNIAESEGVIRKVPLKDTGTGVLYESLPFVMAVRYLHGHENSMIRKLESKKSDLDYRVSYLPKKFFNTASINNVLDSPARYAKLIHDKIVLIGEVNEDGNLCSLDDMHFTPINAKVVGRSKPDMEGVYIHANTIHSIISQQYFTELSSTIVQVISFLFCLPIIAFLLFVYCRPHHIFHFLMVLIYEPFIYFGLIFLSNYLYANHIYFQMEKPFFILTVSPFVLYILDLLDMWINKGCKKWVKQPFPSYFSLKRVDHFHIPKTDDHEKDIDHSA